MRASPEGLMAITIGRWRFITLVGGAMAAKVTEHLWEMSDIVDVLEAWQAANRVGIC